MQPLNYVLWIPLVVILCLSAQGQYALDADQLTSAPYQWYDQKIDPQNSGLVNGEYEEVKRISKNSHSFFESDNWTQGTIHFRGQRYDSVYMTYDVHRDLLLIRHPTQYAFHNQAIKPIQQHILEFEIFQHHFVRLDNDELTGFYDALYNGDHLELVVKRYKKTVVERSVEYESEDRIYFLFKDNYYQLKNKSSLLKVLPEHKKAIKDFVSSHKLTIKKDHDMDCVELIEFIDQNLINQ